MSWGHDGLYCRIEELIDSASVCIAIFSPRYAESSVCLNELVHMLELGKTILPVFYKVNPSDLRQTGGGDGVYARALRTLQEKITFDPETHQMKPRYDSATIEKWKKALFNVSGMRGFNLQACNGDEGLLVDKVVERVAEMLGLDPLPWQPHGHLEGDDSEAVSLLHPDDANGSGIESGLPQALGSNNDSQPPDIEMGVVASGRNGANTPGADAPRSNPDHSNDRGGYVQSISSLFATCHGTILSVVALIKSASVSSSLIKIRLIMLLVSALVSAAIIGGFVVKSYKEFRSQNRKLYWVIQRIALFLMFIMISVFLWLASNVLLKLQHPKV